MLVVQSLHYSVLAGARLTKLSTHHMCVIIVHDEHAAEVPKHLDAFQHVVIDLELAS